jgi:hypothetical protein
MSSKPNLATSSATSASNRDLSFMKSPMTSFAGLGSRGVLMLFKLFVNCYLLLGVEETVNCFDEIFFPQFDSNNQ